jgi:hypothetical protein
LQPILEQLSVAQSKKKLAENKEAKILYPHGFKL